MNRCSRGCWGLLGLLAFSAMDCHGGRTPTGNPTQPAPQPEKVVELLFSTRILNTTEPCGCTSTPLGDVARIAGLVSPANTLLLDAGGLRYEPVAISPNRREQARLKADFLEQTWARLGAVTAVQPEDLRGENGLSELKNARRVCANLSGLPDGVVLPWVLASRQGLTFAVIGLADPQATWPTGVAVTDPSLALEHQLKDLGSAIAVVLAAMPRERVRPLARKFPTVRLWVVGADDKFPEGKGDPERLGDALILTPGKKGERLYRVALHLSSQGMPVWRWQPTPQQRKTTAENHLKRVQQTEKQLALLRTDPAADPAFIQTLSEELARLHLELSEAERPLPKLNGFVTAELVPIERRFPRDPKVRQALDDLDRRIGQANLQAASVPPPRASAESPSFVGMAACLGACHFHEAAHTLWRNTQHSRAFRTLAEVGKQLSYDCVRCHTTGFEEPGGSNLFSLHTWQTATAEPVGLGPDLRNITCETCHGPGSKHIGKPSKNNIPTPRPTEDTCLGCHTPEHSDTFEWKAYARSILGPGHGSFTRQELGDGPTGKELRRAAAHK